MRSNAKKVFKALEKKFDKVLKEAPLVLANEGQRVFNENFKKAEFDNQKWEEVDRRIEGTYSYKYPKKKDLGRRTRPILVGKTRRLKNAVNRSINTSKTNKRRIVWGVYDVDYAKYHNEGIGQKKRQFLGVDAKFKKRLTSKFNKMWRAIK